MTNSKNLINSPASPSSTELPSKQLHSPWLASVLHLPTEEHATPHVAENQYQQHVYEHKHQYHQHEYEHQYQYHDEAQRPSHENSMTDTRPLATNQKLPALREVLAQLSSDTNEPHPTAPSSFQYQAPSIYSNNSTQQVYSSHSHLWPLLTSSPPMTPPSSPHFYSQTTNCAAPVHFITAGNLHESQLHRAANQMQQQPQHQHHHYDVCVASSPLASPSSDLAMTLVNMASKTLSLPGNQLPSSHHPEPHTNQRSVTGSERNFVAATSHDNGVSSAEILHHEKNLRVFKCPIEGCSITAPTSSSLKRHLRVHTNAKPYKCTNLGCPKSFSRRDNASVHSKRHCSFGRVYRMQQEFAASHAASHAASVSERESTEKSTEISQLITHSPPAGTTTMTTNPTFNINYPNIQLQH